MPGKGSWKTALKYTLGILILAVSAAVAWFLPGWYAGWQDGQITGHAILSQREGIQFLDTTSLDIADRLKMLQETDVFSWDIQSVYTSSFDAEDEVQRCASIMKRWCDAGLFPSECLDVIYPDWLIDAHEIYVYLEDTAFPVRVLMFYNEDMGCSVKILMDTETDLFYYVTVVSPQMPDFVAKDLGYESFLEMAGQVDAACNALGFDIYYANEETDKQANRDIEDVIEFCADQVEAADDEDYDFAAALGAQSARTERVPGYLEMEVSLSFENLTGYAFRRLSVDDMPGGESGMGFAVACGTSRWFDCASEDASFWGYHHEPADDVTWEFYAFLAWYARGEAMLDFLPPYEEYEKLYGAAGESVDEESVEPAVPSAISSAVVETELSAMQADR